MKKIVWLASLLLGIGLGWTSCVAEAGTLLLGNWNTSTNLDSAAGGSTAPTTIGAAVAITTGGAGRFSEGINLPLGTEATGLLSYSAAGNINKN